MSDESSLRVLRQLVEEPWVVAGAEVTGHMRVCPVCHALVPWTGTDGHMQWHTDLERDR